MARMSRLFTIVEKNAKSAKNGIILQYVSTRPNLISRPIFAFKDSMKASWWVD